MEVGQCRIKYNDSRDTFRIWGIGDTHLGTKQCAEKQLKETIKRIKDDPNARFFCLGDLAEYVNWQDDKRFDPNDIADWVKVSDLSNLHMVYINKIRELFDPISDKCLGVVEGNHELVYQQRHSVVITSLLAEQWKTKYLDYSAGYRIIFNYKSDKHHATSLTFYLYHGNGGSSSKGGKASKLSSYFSDYPWADVVYSAHLHDSIVFSQPCTDVKWPLKSDDKGEIRKHWRLALMVGGFRETISQPGTHASYSEIKGHTLLAPGAVYVDFSPYDGILKGTIEGKVWQ